jgi:hypothetical protein
MPPGNDTTLPFELSAVTCKEMTAALDGGRLSFDGLCGIERRVRLAERLAECIMDRRYPSRIDHWIVEVLRLGCSLSRHAMMGMTAIVCARNQYSSHVNL